MTTRAGKAGARVCPMCGSEMEVVEDGRTDILVWFCANCEWSEPCGHREKVK